MQESLVRLKARFHAIQNDHRNSFQVTSERLGLKILPFIHIIKAQEFRFRPMSVIFYDILFCKKRAIYVKTLRREQIGSFSFTFSLAASS